MATAGVNWFNLPRTNLTPELKRDLQVLSMRSVLDPKRHYKKESGNAHIPTYSHVGTVLEGATEFYSARIQRRNRKGTIAEEVLAGEASSGRLRSNYRTVQRMRTSGKTAHYKALKTRRYRNACK